MNESEPASLKVYVVRHGETDWTSSSQHTGLTDISLNGRGEAQARKLRTELCEVSFSHVLTSPFRRARQTCALAGLAEGSIIDPLLAEWGYGDYEGLRSVDIRKERPDWNLFRDGCPNGETPAQASARADHLISRLRKLTGNVAIFSHGQFSAALVARWIGEPVLEAQHFRLGTASVSVLGYDPHHPDVPIIDLLNSKSDLPSHERDHDTPDDAEVGISRADDRGELDDASDSEAVATLDHATSVPIFPLSFDPIYQYRLWGGRSLANLLAKPLPPDALIGEAWVLSDRDDFPSVVVDGRMQGWTIKRLVERWPMQMLGNLAGKFDRFPLLLKFLDVHEKLSVQVHPSDSQKQYIPRGEHGKTEAWVVLETEPDACVYAGLVSGTSAADLQQAAANHKIPQCLASLVPKAGDGIFIHSGTVHSLGGVVVFEIQENSDVTFRLYDWDHVDAQTGKPRDLQFDQALAVIDFERGPVHVSAPVIESTIPLLTEKMFDCEHFKLWRHRGEAAFFVGAPCEPRVLVCLDGVGNVEFAGILYALRKGEVMLLPAAMGRCVVLPSQAVIVLEIAIPDTPGEPRIGLPT